MIGGEKTIVQIAPHQEVYPGEVTSSKSPLLQSTAGVFGDKIAGGDPKGRLRELNAKVGELLVERNFLEVALGNLSGTSCKSENEGNIEGARLVLSGVQ